MFKIVTAKQRFSSASDWITTYSLFSFQQHFDASNTEYGRLIAFNDYILDGGKVFPKHPHENKDQIFLVLEGTLITDDNLGNKDSLTFGDVQCIMAGEGYSRETCAPGPPNTRYLGIWLDAAQKNIPPAYKVLHFLQSSLENALVCVVGKTDGAISSSTEVHLGRLNTPSFSVPLNPQGKTLLYMCNGTCCLHDTPLEQGDHVRIEDETALELRNCQNALVLLLTDV